MRDTESSVELQTRNLGVVLVRLTENFLTRRKRKRLRRADKARRRGPIADWVVAILVAMGWVLLINQYAVQAYAIPSPSMEPTLQIGDRLFVDKMSYGPELLPGIGKLPALSTPARNDIVVFESPQYVSRGPVFETLNRIVHMATLSLVTIDRDQNGEPRAQFLIKRVVGVPGDIVTFHKDTGAFLVRPHGESAAIDDRTLANNTHGTHKVQRLVDPQRGTAIRDVAQRVAHLRASAKDQEARANIREKLTSREARGLRFKYWYWHEVAAMDPADARTRAYVAQFDNGIYVPDGRFLPLGDNRDNSHDGRYYGPVRNDALFGRPLLRMWPLSRIGAIR